MAATAELLIKVQADAGQATAALRSASDGLKQLAGTTTTATEKAATSHGIFSRFGEQLTSVGKIAAGMATGMLAANLTMGIAERFKDAASQIDVFGNAVRKIQIITGDSAENTSALVAIFQRFGFTGDEAASKLSRFERALVGQESALDLTQAGGKKGADILHSIGVATVDATGKTLPMIEVLKNLAGQWNTLDAETKNATARGLFGGLGGGGSEQINLMLSQGREGFEAIIESARKYGLVLTQENIEDVKRFTFAHRDMDMALQGVSLQLGAAFMPAITRASQVTASFAQAINQAVMPAIKAIPGVLPAISVGLGVLVAGAAVQATAAMVRFAVVGLASTVKALAGMAIAAVSAAVSFYGMASAAIASAAASVAAWVAASLPIVLVIGAVVAALGLFYLAWQNNFMGIRDIVGGVTQFITDKIASLMDWLAEHHLGVAANWREGWQKIKDDAATGIQGIGSSIKSGVDGLGGSIKSGLDGLMPNFGDTGKEAGDQFGEGVAKGIEETAGVKAAKAAKDAADAALKGIQDATTSRKLNFELAHVDDERNVLVTKLDQTQAEGALVSFKRQMEDLDANSVNYAQQRLALDEQDAITKAKIAESALKANNEDLSYQEHLVKAQLIASRHGGPAMDRSAARTELRDLHNQQILMAPALLVAEHNTTLANRAKEQTDLTASLGKTDLERQKLAIQEAMAPFEAAAVFAKRVAEDAQRSLDLAKQNFAIWETYFEKDRLRAEIAAKDADARLVDAQAAGQAPITVNVQPGAIVVQNGGDPQAVADAVLNGVTQAVKDAKASGPMVVSPKLGGAGYAA